MDDTLQRAMAAHQSGDLGTADRLYQDTLKAQPDQYDALRLRGMLLLQRGAPAEARSLLKRATEVLPQNPEAWVNIASLEQMLGEVEPAIAAIQKALALDASLAAAHNTHANILLTAGRADEAEAAYGRALALEPGDASLMLNLAGAQHAAGRLDAAAAACREILLQQPGFAPALVKLGAVLADLGDLPGAEEALAEAVRLAPGQAEWRYSLAQAIEARGAWRDALEHYRAAADAGGGWMPPVSAGAFLARRTGDWSQRDQDLTRYRAGIAAHRPGASPFISLFETDDRRLQRDAARLWTAQLRLSVQQLIRGRGFQHQRQRRSRITIGYLSSGFGSHATAALTAGVFAHHDRARFRTVAYSLTPDDGTPLAARVRDSFDAFHDCAARSPMHIAARIHDDQVDVLVDLNGYTDGGRPEVLALGAAPVQVAWLAYPGTQGGITQYLVADPQLVRAGEQADYDEALILMPGCYQPTDPTREIAATPERAAVGLPDDAVVLACFNNGYKISPEVFADWMAILDAVPDAVLWLLDTSPDASLRASLTAAAIARGMDPSRLVFAGKAPHAEYLARYRLADLVLDTFPYTAHTTASDALFAGCPLLTREGASYASRVAASILGSLGLNELITRDAASYRDRAIALARDPAERASLRERIAASRGGGSVPPAELWDPARYARRWEAALETVHQRWLDDESPLSFSVDPSI